MNSQITKENRRRLAIYPMAFVLGVGLVYAGFFYKPSPDVAQLLSSAQILAQCGVLDDAMAHCRRALDQDEKNLHGWLVKGFIEERKQDYPAAFESYTRALELTSDRPLLFDIRLSRVDLARRMLDYTSALDQLSALETDYGRSTASWRLRGVIALDQSQFEAALAAFREVLVKNPSDGEIQALAARSLVGLNRFDEARTQLENIHSNVAVVGPIWCLIARRNFEFGDIEAAREALRRYLAIDTHARHKLEQDPFWRVHLANDVFLDVLK